MKKVIFTLFAGLMVSAQVLAVAVKDVCGQFNGDLNIGGTPYPNRTVYLLPGTAENALTFVLPDFIYNAGKLGNIVLPDIPMDETGKLTLNDATLYLDSISERATITVVNGLKDGDVEYNSIVSAEEAQVLLSIAASSLPEPILVLFQGKAAKDKNFTLVNGGFEGAWTNDEPQGWHSFNSATGVMVDFIKNNYQFTRSTLVRPGSKGAQSALLSSTMALGVKANGNCTNGQINAGSSTADDPKGNYNFSDPANEGFNTPFNGRPDSIVFWAKYQPADRNPANEVNKARLNVIITTNARYQDPEEEDKYGDVKIGTACVNYAANAQLDWQRIAVPFEYLPANKDKQPAYILTTFSTNMVPGGGSSYSEGSVKKVNVLDSVYLDDVEVVYNKSLTSFAIDGNAVTFDKHIAKVQSNYCDDCAKFKAVGNGLSAQTFIGFDATHRCIYIYVIAEDYAQTRAYNLYRVDFADSDTGDLDPIDPQEAIETIQSRTAGFEKVMINGQLLIRHGNDWYNVAGMKLK